jgi:predicted methyltransferase
VCWRTRAAPPGTVRATNVTALAKCWRLPRSPLGRSSLTSCRSAAISRVCSAALVGAAGRAYAVVPEDLTRIERIAKGRAEIAAFAASEPTIKLASGPVAQPGALPEPVDLFWISENYHDLHNAFMAPVDIGAFNAAVFKALKPGGRLLIIDHVAAKGAPQDVTEKLHRIEPAVARREIEAAGFKWDGESDALVNRADRHACSIFARGVRYHTDRFIHRFRKPA